MTVDITLEAKERKLLVMCYPHGCTATTLISAGRATRQELEALTGEGRRLIAQTRPGCYALTEHGLAALGELMTTRPGGGQRGVA